MSHYYQSQFQAQDPEQKYKEGKSVLEKARWRKLLNECSVERLLCCDAIAAGTELRARPIVGYYAGIPTTTSTRAAATATILL